MTYGQRIIETGSGVRLHAATGGSGPLVVFLHGIGGNAAQWAPVLGGPDGAFATVAWDARGYGASTGPPVARFSDFAEDLLALIDAMGSGPVLGVGHSMGGRILIEAACLRPQAFGALLLSGTQSAYLAHLSPVDRDGYVARRLGMFEHGRVGREQALAVAREVLPSNAPDDLVARLAADFERLTPEGYGAALRASAGWDRSGSLGALTMPVDVVGGTLDPICPPAQTRALAEAVGSRHVTILDGVSHMMQLEAPQQVTELIAAFVDRHGTRAVAVNLAADRATDSAEGPVTGPAA